MFILKPLQTFRTLFKHGTSSLINILGFTIGLMCIFFLYFYIGQELSYDSFHRDRDKIYRVLRVSTINGTKYDIGVTSGPYAGALLQDFENTIQSACRAMPDDGLVSFEDKRFMEDEILFADENFFQFFDFKLVSGDPESVLGSPNSLVISETLAEKYFGGDNPLGKTIHIRQNEEYPFIISGVFRDSEEIRSHLAFELVGNIEFYDSRRWFHNWWSNGLITYVKIDSRIEAAGIEQQFPSFMDKYFGDDFKRSGNRINLKLEPMGETYFNNQTRYDFAKHGDYNSIRILGLVGIAILFIACFNYVNLAMAFSFKRAKEVGVRKVLGVTRSRLITQFVGESFLVLIVSFVVAGIMSELLRPAFNSFFQLDVTFKWMDIRVGYFIAGLMVALLLFSSLYPAALMSSFRPLSVLNGRKITFGKNMVLRKGLVIMQFTISIFMIAATLLIASQLDFVRNKDLGFRKNAILIVSNNNSDIRQNVENFKAELLTSPHVLDVSSMSGEPGGFHDATTIQIPGVEKLIRMRTAFSDYNYLRTLGITLTVGSNFEKELLSEENAAIIINESGLNELGLTREEIIGREVTMPGWEINGKIVGISEDFHFSSLRDRIEPLIMVHTSDYHRQYAIALHSENLLEGMNHVEETWTRFSPTFPIQYKFLDDALYQLYENEVKQNKVFSAFSGVSIFLACLGILGLVSYSAKQRQKELGIRKILGASVAQIISLVSKEYLVLISAAAVLAIPACWYFIDGWLESFAYRIEINAYWYLFLYGGIVSAMVALLTIALRTYKSAIISPTESIKYE